MHHSFYFILRSTEIIKKCIMLMILIFSQFTPMYVSKNLSNAHAQVLTQLRHQMINSKIDKKLSTKNTKMTKRYDMTRFQQSLKKYWLMSHKDPFYVQFYVLLMLVDSFSSPVNGSPFFTIFSQMCLLKPLHQNASFTIKP